MPTYEYKCLSCGRRLEVFQSMTDKPLTECAECHGKLKRLVGTGAGFLFKGSGFYITDYRSDAYRQAEKQASSSTVSSSSSSSSSGSSSSSSSTSTPSSSPAAAAPAASSGSSGKPNP